MRSDRLKQVMQELDPSFDEKNLGMAKFSRFVQEASHRGLIAATKLDNGQLEIDVPAQQVGDGRRALPEPEPEAPASDRGAPGDRGRRTRRGRGRDRGRGRERETRRVAGEAVAAVDGGIAANGVVVGGDIPAATLVPIGQLELTPEPTMAVGASGERLTRDEAFDLVRRAVDSLTSGDDAARAGDVRRRARELLGRDSESLSERNFGRVIRDAHDADVIDLRRRGDDFEVARAAAQAPVPDQLTRSPAAPSATPSAGMPSQLLPGPRMGIGPRGTGIRGRSGRGGPPPPELLSVGIVPAAPTATAIIPPAPAPAPVEPTPPPTPEPQPIDAEIDAAPDAKGAGRSTARRGRGRKQTAKRAAARGPATEVATPDLALEAPPDGPVADAAPAVRRSGRTKTTAKGRRSRKSPSRGGEA
jgi:hypothetical protein